MFGTALSYVSLRLLGVGPEAEECAAARAWMHERGGATYITSWWVSFFFFSPSFFSPFLFFVFSFS